MSTVCRGHLSYGSLSGKGEKAALRKGSAKEGATCPVLLACSTLPLPPSGLLPVSLIRGPLLPPPLCRGKC